MTSPAKPVRPFTGRHMLIAVVSFFVVVIGLDALFSFWAVSTFPGEVSAHAYEEGLAFNQAIATRRAQAGLGWRAQVTQAGRPGAINALFVDAHGAPVEGLTVKATFSRPATLTGTRVALLRASSPGSYAGAAPLAEGAWDLTLVARDPAGRSFVARRRLVWR